MADDSSSSSEEEESDDDHEKVKVILEYFWCLIYSL
jgi:hypothetical protein